MPAVGNAVGQRLGATPLGEGANLTVGGYAARLGASGAALIANAGTRSLLDGTSFGDNVVAALPDVIAQTIGDVIFNGVKSGQAGTTVSGRAPIRPGEEDGTGGELLTADGKRLPLGRAAAAVRGIGGGLAIVKEGDDPAVTVSTGAGRYGYARFGAAADALQRANGTTGSGYVQFYTLDGSTPAIQSSYRQYADGYTVRDITVNGQAFQYAGGNVLLGDTNVVVTFGPAATPAGYYAPPNRSSAPGSTYAPNLIQRGLDGIGSALGSAERFLAGAERAVGGFLDANPALRNATAQLWAPAFVASGFVRGGLRAGQGLTSLAARPQESLLALAGGIDRVLLDRRSPGEVLSDTYQAARRGIGSAIDGLQSASAYELLSGAGGIAFDVGTLVAPGGALTRAGRLGEVASVGNRGVAMAIRERALIDAAETIGPRGLRGTSVVSTERAEAFLVKNGFTPARAQEFIGSFDGPITARIVRPGEDFLRYTDYADSTGSFLTKTRFGGPAEAVDGLYLAPYGNGATLVQPVTSTGRSIVLEGAIKNGAPGVGQTVINNRSAFYFGPGVGY